MNFAQVVEVDEATGGVSFRSFGHRSVLVSEILRVPTAEIAAMREEAARRERAEKAVKRGPRPGSVASSAYDLLALSPGFRASIFDVAGALGIDSHPCAVALCKLVRYGLLRESESKPREYWVEHEA